MVESGALTGYTGQGGAITVPDIVTQIGDSACEMTLLGQEVIPAPGHAEAALRLITPRRTESPASSGNAQLLTI